MGQPATLVSVAGCAIRFSKLLDSPAELAYRGFHAEYRSKVSLNAIERLHKPENIM